MGTTDNDRPLDEIGAMFDIHAVGGRKKDKHRSLAVLSYLNDILP